MRTLGLKINISPGIIALALTEVAVFVTILLSGIPLLSGAEYGFAFSRPNLLLVAIASALFILTMWSLGAYDRRFATSLIRNRGRLLTASVIVAFAFWVIVSGRLGSLGGPKPSLATTCIIVLVAFAGVVLVRAAFGRGRALALTTHRILVLGVGEPAARIEALAGRDGEPGFAIAGFLRGASETHALTTARAIQSAQPIAELAGRLDVAEIVVATANPLAYPTEALWECRLRGMKVTDFRTFLERETGTLVLDELDPSWVVYSDGFGTGWFRNHLKRCFDILISVSFIPVGAPIAAAAMIAILLESGGPVLHRQIRIGRNGRPFMMYKFRSMHVDAERDGVARWAAEGDKRITRVGAVLRRLHIDEIPQALNVLRGDMSFVGPRPERPSFVEELARQIPYFGERHRVRPGITGWAQVNYRYGASVDDAKQKLAFDLYYIKNGNIALDLAIILRTVQAIIWPVGAP